MFRMFGRVSYYASFIGLPNSLSEIIGNSTNVAWDFLSTDGSCEKCVKITTIKPLAVLDTFRIESRYKKRKTTEVYKLTLLL